MTEENADRIEALFHRAAELPPEEHQAFLERACANEPELRAALERLLTDDARLGDDGDTPFLASPLIRAPVDGAAREARPADTLPQPAQLGRYRLIRLLGQGGMGAVYEAEQDHPRRIVALKVIRPGFASPSLLKRFRHESQILGRLHHPGVAQVYEAGLADDGQPFFAMEFIRGLALDEFARLHAPTLEARVELLARVCDAVQHAHDQGVIHRDLKPTNILVEESGQPKVLDFGVARATDASLLTEAALTQTGQLVGTPNYMSPEQMSGDHAAIDRRADVYALGVILFELAAHRLPFRLENRPLAETARIILEEDPPRLGSIDPELRGDVETIVAKAMEKDRERRYPSAAELASDLRRWLAHEPIQARPPSALYHLRKFARRHRALVGGVLATGAALVLGLVVTTLFAIAEANQRGQAEQNALSAEGSARDADLARRSALRETYQARLAAAMMALRDNNVREAALQLETAPPDLRGWEWDHLRARVKDLSPTEVLPQPEFESWIAYFPPGKALIAKKGQHCFLVDQKSHAVLRKLCDEASFLGIASTWSGMVTGYARAEGGATLLFDDGAEIHIPVRWPIGCHLSVSKDRKLLAVSKSSIPSDPVLRLFELPSGRLRLALNRPERMEQMVFSPDGTLLAGGSKDQGVVLWNTATGAKRSLRGHTDEVWGVAFHPDGTRLASCSVDKTIRQWDVASGQQIDVRRRAAIGLAVTYSPDGQWIASSGADRAVCVWKTYDNEPPTVLPDHDGTVYESLFSPDGFTLWTRTNALGRGMSWQTPAAANRVVLRGHPSFIYPVIYSPDGRLLASAGWYDDFAIRLWDAASGTPVAVLEHQDNDHKLTVFSLAFSPDSRRLVSRSVPDETVRIWNVDTGAELAVKTCDTIPWRGGPQSVVITPDGRTILTGAPDGVRRWDLATGEEQSRLPLPIRNIRVLAVRPQDGLLAVSGDGWSIALVDTNTGNVRSLVTPETDKPDSILNSLAFSPDGRQLLAAGTPKEIQVWDVESGELVRELRGNSAEVFAAIFHPDGSRIISAGRDRMIRVWDPAKGDEIARLLGHTDYIFSLSFNPNGTTLASGSGDSTIRLWETERLGRRLDALREEQAARPEAERLLDRLFREQGSADKVAERMRIETAGNAALERAARNALYRRLGLAPHSSSKQ